MKAQWENECISLSVLSVAPGYDSSVGELMYHSVCSRCGPGSIPGHGGIYKGIFPWLITRASLYTVQGGPKANTTAEDS